MRVRARSTRGSLRPMPQAEKTPAYGGTSTRFTCSSAPSAAACIGPPPPAATSTKSRGSYPRRTETSLSALIMFALTSRMIPLAQLRRRETERLAERLQRLLRRARDRADAAAQEVVRVEDAGE